MGQENIRRMAALALAAAAAITLGVVLYSVFRADPTQVRGDLASFARGDLADLEVLSEAPALPSRAVFDAEGRATQLSAFRGQVLVVNLWATWCAPCQEEMPTLAALQTRMAGRGVHVAAISLDGPRDQAAARAMLGRLGGGALAFLGEPTRRIAFELRAVGFPTTIIYDREGRELARLAGAADWNGPEAAALIEAALRR